MFNKTKMFLAVFLERLKAVLGSGARSDSGRRHAPPKLAIRRGGRIDRHLRENYRDKWPPGAA